MQNTLYSKTVNHLKMLASEEHSNGPSCVIEKKGKSRH